MRKLQYPVDVEKYRVTQYFGENFAATKRFYEELGLKNSLHNGIDFACPMGTPVLSVIDGVVETRITADGNKEIFVWGDELRVFVCHLSEFKVCDKQFVKAGDIIGLSGNTGKYTTGAHLHFGLYKIKDRTVLNTDNGFYGSIDPLPYFADKQENGTLIKTNYDVQVCFVWGDKRIWIKDENTFLHLYDTPVNKAKIVIVDLPTWKYYKQAGTIYNEVKYVFNR